MSRRKPYTENGIRRVPCRQCGEPSEHQWNLRPCSLGKQAWFGLCGKCDLILNGMVLRFLNVANGDRLLAEYAERND